MRLEIWYVGKTKNKWIQEGENHYLKKCRRFTKVEEIVIPGAKSSSSAIVKKEESERIMKRLQRAPKIYTILLDERGKMRSSVDFAHNLENIFMHRGASLRLITGGPFGVGEDVRHACDEVLSVSKMVFTHEMIRVILMEQIYRAFTILRGESYHHI
jgi:23S rRNA (pseudouridine1915-N3)-methyltransferase